MPNNDISEKKVNLFYLSNSWGKKGKLTLAYLNVHDEVVDMDGWWNVMCLDSVIQSQQHIATVSEFLDF